MSRNRRSSQSDSTDARSTRNVDAPPAGNSEASAPDHGWSPRARWLASGLIAVHLSAVIVAPLANPPPASQLFRELAGWYQPYLQGLYLTHGYRYFAPEPGPSHVLRYEIINTDGTTLNGHFPDRNAHWPRQLYHRWFMLSETVYAETTMLLTEEQRAARDEEVRLEIERLEAQGAYRKMEWIQQQIAREDWELEFFERQQQRLVDAIGRHLLDRYGGQTVLLYLRERQIPPMIDVQLGKRLDDPDYFRPEFEWPLGSISRSVPTNN